MSRAMIVGAVTRPWVPNGYLQITTSASVITATSGVVVPSGTRFCTLQAPTTAPNVRFTDVTASDPTTAGGQIIVAGQMPYVYGANPAKLRLWVTSGTVEVLFYK